MLRKNWKTAAFTIAGLGLMTPAQGDQITDMQAQIDSLRSELSQVQVDQGDNWLNERRAEEVKGLIMEVLSDADTRASLLNDGAIAGHGEDGFFIMSPDGAFAMYVTGQINFQYIYNDQDDSSMSADDDDEGGFQLRRAKINLDGHISSPRVGYHVVLARDWFDSGNGVILEEYNVSHQVNDNLQVAAGLMLLPFQAEDLVDSTRLLAVERTPTNEFFTLNRAEGIRLRYSDGPVRLTFMVSDGADSERSDFEDDESELALTGRVTYLVEGEESQGDDFTGWSGQGQFLRLGAAYHFEYGDGRNGGTDNYHAHTLDAQWENGPYNLFVAYTGASIDPDSSSSADRDMDGLVVQGGIHVVPDKFEVFGQWFTIDGDVSGEDDFDGCVVGFNYYINGHRTKFTTDVIWLNEDAPTSNPFGDSIRTSRLGLIDGKEDEMAIRSQIQVLF